MSNTVSATPPYLFYGSLAWTNLALASTPPRSHLWASWTNLALASTPPGGRGGRCGISSGRRRCGHDRVNIGGLYESMGRSDPRTGGYYQVPAQVEGLSSASGGGDGRV